MNAWRYIQNGQTCGPVETSALRTLFDNGTLARDTLVWTGGMTDWVPANSLSEFAGQSSIGQTPPTIGPGGPPPGNHPPPAPGDVISGPADIENNKVFALLAYIGILFLVPLLAAPRSQFARYHANQGLVLFLASLILLPALAVCMIIPFVGCLVFPLLFLAGLGSLALMILGIVHAASGQYQPLPLIGHIELLK